MARSTTRKDIINGIIAPITMIFARGTGEEGNLGVVVGPALVQAMEETFDAVAVQGVDYAATEAGFTGDDDGDALMARLVQEAVRQSPRTRVVLVGYSQGAMLAHRSYKLLDEDIAMKVVAAVTFGDPYSNWSDPGLPKSKWKVFSADGDQVCAGTAIITKAHFTYAADVPAAVEFVRSKLIACGGIE